MKELIEVEMIFDIDVKIENMISIVKGIKQANDLDDETLKNIIVAIMYLISVRDIINETNKLDFDAIEFNYTGKKITSKNLDVTKRTAKTNYGLVLLIIENTLSIKLKDHEKLVSDALIEVISCLKDNYILDKVYMLTLDLVRETKMDVILFKIFMKTLRRI